jgi:hypothetical protein
MKSSRVALIYGIIFIAAGVAGFIPGLLHPIPHDAPPLTVTAGYGLVLGILPVNVLHNYLHLVFGVLGIAAFLKWFRPRRYLQIVAVAYMVFFLMGLLPATYTTFGLVPIYGADVWLHLVLSLPAAYFGFMAPLEMYAGRQ